MTENPPERQDDFSPAELKAIARMKDIDNESMWIALPQTRTRMTAQEVREHMMRRGYKS